MPIFIWPQFYRLGDFGSRIRVNIRSRRIFDAAVSHEDIRGSKYSWLSNILSEELFNIVPPDVFVVYPFLLGQLS